MIILDEVGPSLQPMETAPKDRPILVKDAHHGFVQVTWGDRWTSGEWCTAFENRNETITADAPLGWMELPE